MQKNERIEMMRRHSESSYRFSYIIILLTDTTAIPKSGTQKNYHKILCFISFLPHTGLFEYLKGKITKSCEKTVNRRVKVSQNNTMPFFFISFCFYAAAEQLRYDIVSERQNNRRKDDREIEKKRESCPIELVGLIKIEKIVTGPAHLFCDMGFPMIDRSFLFYFFC